MIKYEKTTWVDGETVLKADHMKKIEKGIVDLCTEIENIALEATDLSNYYTKTQTDNKISEEIAKAQLGGSGEVDLSAYATKTYVDNEISKIELKEGPQGPKGEQGDKGDVGPQGPQGETPSIAHLEANISNKISEVDELIHQLTNNRTVDGGEL